MLSGAQRIVQIVTIAAACGVLIWLLSRARKLNLKPPKRPRQIFMPVVALIYSVAASALTSYVEALIRRLVQLIPGLIGKLLGLFNAELAARVEGILRNLFGKIVWNYWMFYAVNIAIIVGFFIVKPIATRIMGAAFKNDIDVENPGGAFKGVYLNLVDKFYGFNQLKDRWELRRSMMQTRSLWNVIFLASAVICSIVFLLCKLLIDRGLLASPVYPVICVILIGEIYAVINGCTAEEYSDGVDGEDDDSELRTDFTILQRLLRRLFGDKAAAYDVKITRDFESLSANDIIEELENSGDAKQRSYGSFLRMQSAAGVELDRNLISPSLDLLDGKSVLFANPFYNDLIPYAFYPLNRALLHGARALVICGRHGTQDDIREWVSAGIKEVIHTDSLWRIANLNDGCANVDIGIVSRSDVCSVVLDADRRAFLHSVRYVIVLEPSRLLTTAQFGLGAIVREIGSAQVTFCACDKPCDGLVDALSHALLTNLTEVAPTTRTANGVIAYTAWSADNEHLMRRIIPSISRYLGGGTELAFAALKYQVDNAAWYGGEAFPVTDIHWIATQYLHELTEYAGFSADKQLFDERFTASADMWSAKIRDVRYDVIEDESYNLFEAYTSYASRVRNQGYINIIAPSYLLREYMAANHEIFTSDRKAIPYIAADFARTERNAILRVIMLLSSCEVSESTVKRELSLLETATDEQKMSGKSIPERLWYHIARYNAPIAEAVTYENARDFVIDGKYGFGTLKTAERYNYESGELENVYYVDDRDFITGKVADFRSADYVVETELGGYANIGAELYGHIFQKHLPGQKFTYAGKYYEMMRETADGRILLRRAADHITGRPMYKQKRTFTMRAANVSEQMGAVRDIDGLVITRELADFTVETPAYIELDATGRLSSAKNISISGVPVREYHNKQVLKIELPDCDAETRYTLTVLINELFTTLFAENKGYVCAVTDDSGVDFGGEVIGAGESDEEETALTYDEDGRIIGGDAPADDSRPADNAVSPLEYKIAGNFSSEAIYIFEDSKLDIGLLIAVERNIDRIFEILTDFLTWHEEAMEQSQNPAEEPRFVPTYEQDDDAAPVRKKGLFGAIGGFFKRLFKRKPKTPEGDNPPSEGTPLTSRSPLPFNGASDVPLPCPKPKYHETHYLLYGYARIPAGIVPERALSYLEKLGYGNNYLYQARHGQDIIEQIESTYRPFDSGIHLCDFCGAELSGVSYEVLKDGRERCGECSRTALKKASEFTEVFSEVAKDFERIFNTKLNASVKVQMTTAKKIAKATGRKFVATPGFDSRAIGLAIESRDGFTLLVENGSPRVKTKMTIAHELTHIWQYAHWNRKIINGSMSKQESLELYEGMATWAEIQYAYAIRETAAAKRWEMLRLGGNDEYGNGLKKYLEKYSFKLSASELVNTPFANISDPLLTGSAVTGKR
jgi:hypothetical protein